MNKKGKTSICRVCLADNVKCISLFQEYKNSYIYTHIKSLTSIEIKENDGLPDSICTSCLLDLETAITFKEKCESSDFILHTSTLNRNEVQGNEVDVVIKKEENEEPEIEFLDSDSHFFDSGFFKNDNDEDEDENGVPRKLNMVELGLKKSRAIDLQLQCDDCKEFFKSKCKLRVHWKKVHFLESLICSRCKRTFKSYKAFHSHNKNQRKSCVGAENVRIEGEGRKRIFHCRECVYKSRRMKDMLSHLVIHTGDRPFKCDLCPTACTQQSSLQAHKESVHKLYIQETTCDYCGKTLRGRNRIYRHLKTHRSKSIECPVCKKILKGEIYLKVHMTRHSGVKSYTCEICAKTFYTTAELSTHRRTVHFKGNCIFKCDLCDYKSHRNESIKKHKVKHSNSNLPCTVCGMFFENAQKLYLHQRRHFEEKKFACPHCDMKFYRRDSVGKHVRAKHKCTLLINKPAIKVKKELPVVVDNIDSDILEVNLITSD